MIMIRPLRIEELEWLNAKYDELTFLHSDFFNEIIAVCEYNGGIAGVGRIIKIDENNAELCGMYVFPEYRNKGISKYILNYLLKRASSYENIYCIPCVRLGSFYRSCGFNEPMDFFSIPGRIKAKYNWYSKLYDAKMLLLKYNGVIKPSVKIHQEDAISNIVLAI